MLEGYFDQQRFICHIKRLCIQQQPSTPSGTLLQNLPGYLSCFQFLFHKNTRYLHSYLFPVATTPGSCVRIRPFTGSDSGSSFRASGRRKSRRSRWCSGNKETTFEILVRQGSKQLSCMQSEQKERYIKTCRLFFKMCWIALEVDCFAEGFEPT